MQTNEPIMKYLSIKNLDYMLYPGSNKLWPKDEFGTPAISNCCFQPMWKKDADGSETATCSLRGKLKSIYLKIGYLSSMWHY